MRPRAAACAIVASRRPARSDLGRPPPQLLVSWCGADGSTDRDLTMVPASTRLNAASTSSESPGAREVAAWSLPGSRRAGRTWPQLRHSMSPRRQTSAVEPHSTHWSRSAVQSCVDWQYGQTRTCLSCRTPRFHGLLPRTGSACRAPQRWQGMCPLQSCPTVNCPDYESSASTLRYSLMSRASGMSLTTFQRTTPVVSMTKVPRVATPRSSLNTP